MAVTVLERGIRGFFSKIVGFVCKFVITEKIAKWIADQGGWVSAACNLMLNCNLFIFMSVIRWKRLDDSLP